MATALPNRRTAVHLDMTPMVDLAFLLVTFFMLTTNFAPDDPVAIRVPKSVYPFGEPEGMLTILVAKDGRLFYDSENQRERAQLIQRMGSRYGLTFSGTQITTFSKISAFGMDVRRLPAYLNLSAEERKRVMQEGIPVKASDNQLANWLREARMVNPKLQVAIKCDAGAQYPLVRQVINTLQDQGISRFGLITDTEVH